MTAKESAALGTQLVDGTRKGLYPKVECPHCGYEMPITYDPDTAKCNDVFVRCKGRGCKELFEINLGTK